MVCTRCRSLSCRCTPSRPRGLEPRFVAFSNWGLESPQHVPSWPCPDRPTKWEHIIAFDLRLNCFYNFVWSSLGSARLWGFFFPIQCPLSRASSFCSDLFALSTAGLDRVSHGRGKRRFYPAAVAWRQDLGGSFSATDLGNAKRSSAAMLP